LTVEQRPKWYVDHPEREEFYKLIETSPDNINELKMALLKRAMRNVSRAWELSEERQPLSKLMRSGALSDQMWEQFTEAEKDLQLEVYDLEADAEIIAKGIFTLLFLNLGWGKQIMSQAAQLLARQRQAEMQEKIIQQKKDEEDRMKHEEELAKEKALEDEEMKELIAQQHARELLAEERKKPKRKSSK
jgi:translocation protein SEC66